MSKLIFYISNSDFWLYSPTKDQKLLIETAIPNINVFWMCSVCPHLHTALSLTEAIQRCYWTLQIEKSISDFAITFFGIDRTLSKWKTATNTDRIRINTSNVGKSHTLKMHIPRKSMNVIFPSEFRIRGTNAVMTVLSVGI